MWYRSYPRAYYPRTKWPKRLWLARQRRLIRARDDF